MLAALRLRVELFDLVRPELPVSWVVTVPATRVTWLRAIWPPVSAPEVRVTRLATPVPVVPVRSRVAPSTVTVAPERAALEPAARVPPVTLTLPVKRLVPVRVRMPSPVLTRPRLPETTPAKAESVAPETVTVAALTASALVSSPPVPTRLERETERPLRSTVPLAESVRLRLAAPSAVALPTVTLPADTATPPVKVLAPLRTTSPATALTKAAEPVRVAATVPALAVTWLTAMEPPVSVPPSTVTPLTIVLPLRSREPAETVTALLPSAALEPRATVPPAMVVTPVKPVLSPVMIRVPLSVLLREPSPARRDARVPALAVRVVAVARLMVPPVMVPPLRKVVLPMLAVPRLTVPELTVRLPEPKAVFVPALTVPPSTVTPPLKSLEPLRLATPEPVLVTPPRPVIEDEIVPAWTLTAVPVATLMVPPWIVPPVMETELAMEAPVRSRVPAVTVTVPEPRAVSAVAARVPAETVVPPLKSLEPERVSVPLADLASAPEPVSWVPTEPVTRVTLAIATWPPTRAPELRVIAFARPAAPVRSSVPPLTATRLVAAPKAVALPATKVPSLTWTLPTKVFAPERTCVAKPYLTTPRLPERTPEKVEVVATPVARMRDAFVTAALVTAPAPAREATTAVRPLRSIAPSAPTVTALREVPSAAALPRVTLPASTVTPPVKVLAPERVTSPEVVLFRPALPVRTAAISPEVATTLAASIEPPVSVPPATVTRLEIAVSLRLSVPPLTLTPPEPRAKALPTTIEPAERVTTPEKSALAPESVRTPVTDLVSVDEPTMSAEIAPDFAVRFATSKEPPVSSPPSTTMALVSVWPPRSSVPPVRETVPLPRAVPLPAMILPPEMSAPPEKLLFAPDSVTTPAAVLASLPEPVSFVATVPATGTSCATASSPPVRVPPESVMVFAKPVVTPRSSVPPVTLTAPVLSAETWPTTSVPWLTTTGPAKVLRPSRRREPLVFLVRPLVPLSVAETTPVRASSWPTSRSPPVSVPPLTVTRFAMVWPLRFNAPPPAMVTTLVPSDRASPMTSVPPLMSVTPV